MFRSINIIIDEKDISFVADHLGFGWVYSRGRS